MNYYQQALFIRESSLEDVKEHLAKNNLHPMAEVELVRRGEIELLKPYFSSIKKLAQNSEVELVRLGNTVIFDLYIEQTNLCAIGAMELARFGKEELLMAYAQKYPFSVLPMVEVIRRGCHCVIMQQLKLHAKEVFLKKIIQVELIHRGNVEEIRLLLSTLNALKEILNDGVDVELIRMGNHDLILQMVSNFCLCDEAEVFLIRRGVHDEIMSYLYGGLSTGCSAMCQKAEIELVRRGNEEEISCYIDREDICTKAQICLVQLGNWKLIYQYGQKKFSWNDEVKGFILASYGLQ